MGTGIWAKPKQNLSPWLTYLVIAWRFAQHKPTVVVFLQVIRRHREDLRDAALETFIVDIQSGLVANGREDRREEFDARIKG